MTYQYHIVDSAPRQPSNPERQHTNGTHPPSGSPTGRHRDRRVPVKGENESILSTYIAAVVYNRAIQTSKPLLVRKPYLSDSGTVSGTVNLAICSITSRKKNSKCPRRPWDWASIRWCATNYRRCAAARDLHNIYDAPVRPRSRRTPPIPRKPRRFRRWKTRGMSTIADCCRPRNVMRVLWCILEA